MKESDKLYFMKYSVDPDDETLLADIFTEEFICYENDREFGEDDLGPME
ncbi:MAG: hypothetical protein LJE94_12370 [Deltaproteobacteria bacterium]|nr:hypothetical protein [Deltaproteobacteria bacterium]